MLKLLKSLFKKQKPKSDYEKRLKRQQEEEDRLRREQRKQRLENFLKS